VDFAAVLCGRCPVCGGRGHIGLLTPYTRTVVELFPCRQGTVQIARFRCRKTGRTFSLLPLELAPYHQYTLTTMFQTLVLFCALWGPEGKTVEDAVLEALPPDSRVTVSLVRFWSGVGVRGWRRSRPVLRRTYDLSEIRSETGFRGQAAEVLAYLRACRVRGPPWVDEGVLRIAREYSHASRRFLVGMPSQDRRRSQWSAR